MISYQIFIEPQPEGGFVISIPSLPGCATEGETLEECLSNIQDAAEGYLKTLWRRMTSSTPEFVKLV
jgi:predicted RNase H-like HicB family nuclease